MQYESLLAYLATTGFSRKPENVATKSLEYILNCSNEAKRAVIKCFNHCISCLNHGKLSLSEGLTFRGQYALEESGIPDLCGCDSKVEVLILEGKFDAGLTEKQPVGYLKSLKTDPARCTMVAFVTPTRNLASLWEELKRLCKIEGESVKSETKAATKFGDFYIAETGGGPYLAAISWRTLLDSILSAVAAEGAAAYDVKQLQGLCNYMDYEVFMELRKEDVAPEKGKIIRQLCQLVEEATSLLEHKTTCALRGDRHSWLKAGSSGYYLFLHGWPCWFGMHADFWSRLGDPLWLVVLDEKRKFRLSPKVEDKLSAPALETLGKVTRGPKQELCISLGVDCMVKENKASAIDSIVEKLITVAGKLKGLRSCPCSPQ